MDRRELLDKAARDAEERMLLSRVWDKWEQCRLRNVPAATAAARFSFVAQTSLKSTAVSSVAPTGRMRCS